MDLWTGIREVETLLRVEWWKECVEVLLRVQVRTGCSSYRVEKMQNIKEG